MAFTYGTANIKLTNIKSVDFTAATIQSIAGANLKDGVSFSDSPDKSIKTADGVERTLSEKTMVKFQVIGLTAAENTDIKNDLHGISDTMVINITRGKELGDLRITITAVFSVLSVQMGNDIPYLEISCEQSAYDVDTISVMTEV